MRTGTVRPWLRSLLPSTIVQVLSHNGHVRAISLSPDGKVIAVSSSSKDAGIQTKIWAAGTWTLLRELQPLEAAEKNPGVGWTGFDYRSSRLFLVSDSGGLYSLDLEAADQDSWSQCPMEPARFAALSPSAPLLAVCDYQNTIRIWTYRLNTFQPGLAVSYTDKGDNHVYAMAFSPDGRYLAAGGGSNVLVWDTSNGAPRDGFDSSLRGYCRSLVFTPDGRYLLAGGGESIGERDPKVCMWCVETGEPEEPTGSFATEPNNPVYSLACHPTEPLVAGVGDGFHAVAVWNTATGAMQYLGEQCTGSLLVVAFDRDGSHLLAGTFQGDVYVLDTAIALAQRDRSWRPNEPGMEWLEFVPHSSYLLGVESARVKAYQLENGSGRRLDDSVCDPFHGEYDRFVGIEALSVHGGNASVALLVDTGYREEGLEIHIYDFGSAPGSHRFHRSFAVTGYEPIGLAFDHHSNSILAWYKTHAQFLSDESECTVCFAQEAPPGDHFALRLASFPVVTVDAIPLSDDYIVFAHEKGLILWSKVRNAECAAYKESLCIAHCALSPDGHWLATVQDAHSQSDRQEPDRIAWWRVGDGRLERIGRTRRYNGVAARSPDGRFDAVCERRADDKGGTKLVILPKGRSRIDRSRLMRCTGQFWLTADDQRYLQVRDGKTGKVVCAVQLPLPILAIAATHARGAYSIAATMNSGDVVAYRVEGMLHGADGSS